MRKSLILVLAVVVAALGLVAGASAVETCLRMSCSGLPTLVPTFGGSVSPKTLPRHEYVPVAASVFGKIKTSDGTHPSALREMVIDIDKDMRINAEGYPTCEGGGRDIGRNPQAVLRACSDAVLGRGQGDFEIAFPEQAPIKVSSPLIVFNGGEKGGEVTLYIHAFLTVPAPTAIVTAVTITRKGSGIDAVAKIPVIAGGSGSVLDFSFKLAKTYAYKGKGVGFLEAKCPDEVFRVSVPTLLFKNEAHTPAVGATTVLKGSFAVPCTPQG